MQNLVIRVFLPDRDGHPTPSLSSTRNPYECRQQLDSNSTKKNKNKQKMANVFKFGRDVLKKSKII